MGRLSATIIVIEFFIKMTKDKNTMPHRAARLPHALPPSLKKAPLLLAALGSAFSCAWAQESKGDATANLNPNPTVTVSAGRLAQRSFDAPAAIASVDGETIAASGQQVNLSDALAGIPGVVSLNRNNYAQDVQISIRGFGARAAFGTQGIRIIADGIPATMPDGSGQASTISLTSVDRVEVLKGPLAQLYGNASGGVIQTWTKEAGDRPEIDTQFYTGSFGLTRTDWQVSDRTDNKKVGVVADYSFFNLAGWRQNAEARREQLNGVITIDPQEDTRVRLVFNSFMMPNAGDPLGLTQAQFNANPRQAGTNALQDQASKTIRQNQIGAVLEQRIAPDLSFEGRVYYGSRDNLQLQAASTGVNNPIGTWVGLNRYYDGVGLQLKGRERDWAIPMRWVVGFDGDRSSEHREGGCTKSGVLVWPSANATGCTGLIGNSYLSRNEQDVATNNDFFVQTDWELSDRWSAVLAARDSNVNLSAQTVSGFGTGGSVNYQAFTPMAGLTFHATDRLNFYGNVGRGFETPSLANAAYIRNPNNLNAILPSFNTNLKAATSVSYELGAKWLPNDQSRLEAALFQVDTENEIVTDLSSGGKTAYKNAPNTQRQGLELSYRDQFAPHWLVFASGTVMKATYSSAFTSGTTPIASGSRIPSIPEDQALANLTWSQEARHGLQVDKLKGAQATLEWVGRSAIYANDANTASAPAVNLFNLRLREGYQVNNHLNLEAFVAINNLSNQGYVGSVIVNQAQSQFFEPALPRNYVLGLKAQIPL